jgi:hypothetical protein
MPGEIDECRAASPINRSPLAVREENPHVRPNAAV